MGEIVNVIVNVIVFGFIFLLVIILIMFALAQKANKESEITDKHNDAKGNYKKAIENLKSDSVDVNNRDLSDLLRESALKLRASVDETSLMNDINATYANALTNSEMESVSAVKNSLSIDIDLPGRRDPLFIDALQVGISIRYISTSLLQRHLVIGYGRAASILDAMIKEGFVGEIDSSNKERPVLISSMQEWEQQLSKAEENESNKLKRLKTKIEETKLYDAPSYKYIKQFAKKYGEKGKSEDFKQLKTLLQNWQYNFSMEELKSLVSQESKKQKVESLKNKIFSDNPHNRGAILKAYLSFYRSDDEANLKILASLLEERYSASESALNLITELQAIEERINLENFERRLSEEDEQIQLSEIDKLNGYEFEDFLKNLFSKMGYQVEQTPLSGDQGADLVVVKFGEKSIIQAKRFGAKVGNKAVQEILAAMSLYKAQKGMVVTNSYFTSAAIELADANKIALIDRDALEELINKHW